MLSTDLATFGATYSTSGSIWKFHYLMCFSRHFVAPDYNHPYVITCRISKKQSKIVGNSASKPLKNTPNELPCITVDWWRIVWKMHYVFQHLIFQIGISKYL